jgi:hypothetical protein
MIKKTVTYTDYNGVERTEDFYFNLNKAEVSEMEMGTTGGFAAMLQKIIDAKDQAAITKTFKEMVLKAYGEKSADGRSFLKEDEYGRPLANKFKQTEAYSNIFMELAFNAQAASAFVKGIIPSDLESTIKKLNDGQKETK